MSIGTLYLVATPIGNLGDITLRAIEILRSVDAIACEDTRRTKKLLSHLGISRPLLSVPSHDEPRRARLVAERLTGGENLAFVTDAGMPGISDPGAAVVAAALEVGARVIPVPGPCAMTSAAAASGLCAGPLSFLGFLPRKRGARLLTLEQFAGLPSALIVYEAPGRVGSTLADLSEVLGADREAALCRELTKVHEEIARGTLGALAERFRDGARGEVTIVVAPAASGAKVESLSLDEALARVAKRTKAGERLKEACKAVASEGGPDARVLYRAAVEAD